PTAAQLNDNQGVGSPTEQQPDEHIIDDAPFHESFNAAKGVFKGMGGGMLKGLLEPELKAGASAIRAIQATPQVLKGAYQAVTDPNFSYALHHPFEKVLNAPSLNKADATMAKPVLGQKTAAGSSQAENVLSAGTGILQLAGLKAPEMAGA